MPSRGYVPLAQNVWWNAKVKRAADELVAGDVDKMVGHLARLWAWALDNAEDGCLGHLSDVEIATQMNWPTAREVRSDRTERSRKAHAERIVTALIAAGLLHADRTVNDWMDYAGQLVETRRKWREKQRARRGVSGTVSGTNTAGVSGTVSGTSSADRDRDATRRDVINPHTPTHNGGTRPRPLVVDDGLARCECGDGIRAHVDWRGKCQAIRPAPVYACPCTVFAKKPELAAAR